MVTRKQSQSNFRKSKNFLSSGTQMYLCASEDTKCSFFGKFDMLCFLQTTVLKFAFLLYYRRNITMTRTRLPQSICTTLFWWQLLIFTDWLNINSLMPDFHWKVIHTWKNLQSLAAGLFKYIWPSSGHQALKGSILENFSNYRLFRAFETDKLTTSLSV